MSSIIHPLLALFHVIITIWAFRLYSRRPSLGLALIGIIAAALVYDNMVIVLGNTLGIGGTLHSLSVGRFAIHALLTPALLIAAYQQAVRSGGVKDSANGRLVVIAVMVGLIGLGVAMTLVNMHLEPACQDGVLRYAERVVASQVCETHTYPPDFVDARGLPPLAAIFTIIGVGILGFFVWRRAGSPLMLVGAVIMVISAAIPASRVGLWVGNLGEVILLGCLVALEAWLQQREGLGVLRSDPQGRPVGA